MQRVDAPEILDSDTCSAAEVQAVLKTLGRINRWFGGVATTQSLVERVADVADRKTLSLLEVASGAGEVPLLVRDGVAQHGISLTVTLLDRARSHLVQTHLGETHLVQTHLAQSGTSKKDEALGTSAVAAHALALPFSDGAFDLVSCSLFAHHLPPEQLTTFVGEALRVSRLGLLINDLVRHPMHLTLVYASFPIMGSRIAWLDGLTSVRRAYRPSEMRAMLSSCAPALAKIEISRHYLFRMGVIVWKKSPGRDRSYGSALTDNQHFPDAVSRQKEFDRSEIPKQ
ncbi:MAG: methyltransferase domain-containing protein [Candidatus Sulfotelmatobacter sp.]